jgi:hypothetical protein
MDEWTRIGLVVLTPIFSDWRKIHFKYLGILFEIFYHFQYINDNWFELYLHHSMGCMSRNNILPAPDPCPQLLFLVANGYVVKWCSYLRVINKMTFSLLQLCLCKIKYFYLNLILTKTIFKPKTPLCETSYQRNLSVMGNVIYQLIPVNPH